MNAQREVVYKRRFHALFGDRLSVDIANMIFDTAEVISHYIKDSALVKTYLLVFYLKSYSILTIIFCFTSKNLTILMSVERLLSASFLKKIRVYFE